jgi:hypothetical protein
MIAGLSAAAWLLISAAIGIGLCIELAFFRAHRRSAGPRNTRLNRRSSR